MASINLTSPQVEHYRKIEAFFKNDPNVTVVYDNSALEVKLYVSDEHKASALQQILPDVRKFGNVKLKIVVYTPNGKAEFGSTDNLLSTAFFDNPAFKYIKTLRGIGDTPFTYVIFTKEVVQYFTDDLSDFFGAESTLYENLARDIFKDIPGVFYCTDIED